MTETKPSIFDLMPKLLAAVGGVARTRSQGVSYSYRSVHDVCQAVRDACASVGVTPQVEFDDLYWEHGASVICHVELFAPDGTSVCGKAAARVPYPKHGVTPQTHGSACSYALKAALQGMLLVGDEDPDAVPEAQRVDAPMVAGAPLEPQRDWLAEARAAVVEDRAQDWVDLNRGTLSALPAALKQQIRDVLQWSNVRFAQPKTTLAGGAQ